MIKKKYKIKNKVSSLKESSNFVQCLQNEKFTKYQKKNSIFLNL